MCSKCQKVYEELKDMKPRCGYITYCLVCECGNNAFVIHSELVKEKKKASEKN